MSEQRVAVFRVEVPMLEEDPSSEVLRLLVSDALNETLTDSDTTAIRVSHL